MAAKSNGSPRLGFPFAPAYLKNLETSSNKSTPIARDITKKQKKARKSMLSKGENSINEHPRVPVEIPTSVQSAPGHDGDSINEPFSLCEHPSCFKLHDKAMLVKLKNSSVHHISGFCHLSLIQGSVYINGFQMAEGSKVALSSPVWTPAARIVSAGSRISKVKPKKKVNALSGSFESSFERVTCGCAVLLVEGIQRSDQEWLIAIEDQTAFQHPTLISNVRPIINPSLTSGYSAGFNPQEEHRVVREVGGGERNGPGDTGTRLSEAVRVGSAVLGTRSQLSSLGIDCLDIPSSWSQSVTVLCEHAISNIPDSDSGQRKGLGHGQGLKGDPGGLRAIICGAKGVGKSTCVRYAVNRLLAAAPHVCVLDCDVGQSEFSVPGMLTLHVIDRARPVLGPHHLDLRTPELSFFVGEVTGKGAPDLIARGVQLLLERYNDLCALHHQQEEREREQDRKQRAAEEQKRRAAAIYNPFDVLAQEDGENRQQKGDGRHDGRGVAMPLLVNTDGYVRFMGAEMLAAVVALVRPTHVLHVSTEKDSDLAALRDLRVANDPGSGGAGVGAGVGACDNGHRGGGGGGGGCEVLTLVPGRLVPARTTAADLRTLRCANKSSRQESASLSITT